MFTVCPQHLEHSTAVTQALLRGASVARDPDRFYNRLCDHHSRIWDFLGQHRYVQLKMLDDPAHLPLLPYEKLRKELLTAITTIEATNYQVWIKKADKKTLSKRAHGYAERLTMYDREHNVVFLSHDDPFTVDERRYALAFCQDVFPEQAFADFTQVPLNHIQIALDNLRSN
jgi:hypothetical protein